MKYYFRFMSPLYLFCLVVILTSKLYYKYGSPPRELSNSYNCNNNRVVFIAGCLHRKREHFFVMSAIDKQTFRHKRSFLAPDFSSKRTTYICVLCSQLLDLTKPYQAECGDRGCFSCVEFLLAHLKESKLSVYPCPGCGESLNADSFFPDRAVARELQALIVTCPNDICSWKEEYIKYLEHFHSCPHQLVSCHNVGCTTLVPRGELKGHLESCLYRRSLCSDCYEKMPHIDLENHKITECEHRPISCSFCGQQVPLSSMSGHVENECKMAEKECEFVYFGCDVKGNSDSLHTHQENHYPRHLQLLAKHVRSLSQRVSAQEGESQSPSSSVLSRVSTLEGGVSRLGQQCSGLRAELSGVLAALQSSQSREVVGASSSTFGSSPVQSRSSTDESVVRLQRSTQELQELYSQMSVAIQTMQASSYGNVFLWRVPDLARRRRDAVLGRTISLYSAPFYTSRHGYKLCLRVYLNGDGAGQRSHLSLFVCMMRGDYDPLLSWPFRQLITLYVLSQDSREKDIKQSFKADEDSPSFCRPVTDMNVASGCPKFCLLTVLDQPAYAAQDTLYLKAVISTKGLESLSSQ